MFKFSSCIACIKSVFLHVHLIPRDVDEFSSKPVGLAARPLVKRDRHLVEIICPPCATELNRIENPLPRKALDSEKASYSLYKSYGQEKETFSDVLRPQF